MTPFSLVTAIARDGAIGHAGTLPWPTLRQDMAWFHWLTTSRNPYTQAVCLMEYPELLQKHPGGFWPTDQNAVIMGRRTWESLPAGMPQRTAIVLPAHTTPLQETYHGSVWRVPTFPDALVLAHEVLHAPNVFAIGGAQVYAEALHHPDCQTLYLTEIDAEYPQADTWFPTPTFSFEEMWHGEDVIWDDAPPTWHRTHVSAWITELDRPRYRFGIWQPLT